MDCESGIRSWFNRAIQLSPNFRLTSSTAHDGSDDEDTDYGNVDYPDWSRNYESIFNDSNKEVESLSQNPGVDGRTKSSKYCSKWRLLLKDNIRLWDCLATLRADPSMSCHSAIYVVTQLPESEYFTQTMRSAFDDLKDNSRLEVEILRLTVENRRLHAVLWVLADNPQIRMDSVLTAVFRLNDEQFEDKFKFEYRPDCFSARSPSLGSSRKNSTKTIIAQNKRSRSSTPIRTYCDMRNLTDRLSHSVSRRSTTRKGQNFSSNRKSCPTYKLGPSGKHPNGWTMSALLTGIDNKLSGTLFVSPWEKSLNCDKKTNNFDEINCVLYHKEAVITGDIVDRKEEAGNSFPFAVWHCKQPPSNNRKLRPRSDSLCSNLRFKVQDIADHNNSYNNNNMNMLRHEMDHNNDNTYPSDAYTGITFNNKLQSISVRGVTCNVTYFERLRLPSNSLSAENSIMFKKGRKYFKKDINLSFPEMDDARQTIHRETFHLALPYRIPFYITPAQLINSQYSISQRIADKQRKTNIKFCLPRRLTPSMLLSLSSRRVAQAANHNNNIKYRKMKWP